MREKILTFIEKNSRIDIKELAIILGEDELSVANELAAMEADHNFRRSGKLHLPPGSCRYALRSYQIPVLSAG